MSRKRLIPLLKDHHSHPSVYSALAESVDLKPVSSLQQALSEIRSQGQDFCIVHGWDNSRYQFSRSHLEELPPVFILNLSLHSFLLNDSGRRELQRTHPEIVAHERDSNWIERNLPSVLKMVVEIKGCSGSSLSRFFSHLATQGVWHVEEMLLPNAGVIDAFRQAELLERTAFWADPEAYQSLGLEDRALVRGMKLFADGALGAYTAAISQAYSEGRQGLLLYSNEELRELLSELSEIGKPLAIHAIGDRALDQVLDQLESLATRGQEFPSVRLEHCQFITRRNAGRAREMRITLSMQPNFSLDSLAYRDRLGHELVERNNPFRMLIDEAGFIPGKDLILGSDGMPHGVEWALNSALFPPQPEQRLSLEEFAAGYCLPDLERGWVELEIDEPRQRVRICRVEVTG